MNARVIPLKPRKAAPRARRTNEARSAETRGRLIEATVASLNNVGYAGTTTILVNEMSGVTRGGLLHHFPSKVDLLIATAEHCLERMRDERRARNVKGEGPAGIMQVERGRFGIALCEIMLGSRSDKELARRFKPVGELILQSQRNAARMIVERAGIPDHLHQVEVNVWLTMAAIRGMTLMELAGVDSGLTDEALTLIDNNSRAMNRALRGDKPKPAK
jgi:AcrR family transcriptional regulator